MFSTRLGPAAVVGVALWAAALGAQTVITPPRNDYTPAQDVELGREAAAEVEKQLPILSDEAVTASIASLGERLVAVIPQDLHHSEFRYSFKVVNVREINAFALPGGPMYVNRGMIEAAKTEGEVTGVMAHELSHVALRHGTAQATKSAKYQLGGLLGAVVGSVIGGNIGSVVSQGTQFGLNTAFLRFSREDERQADLLGARIMARAGYDPRDMASMFKTIEKQGGSSGPQWLSDHPNPGNRYEYIMREAQALEVRGPVQGNRVFTDVQARLRGMTPAPTAEEATRTAAASSGSAPTSAHTTYTAWNRVRVSVPSNWRELPGDNAVTFAPEGAYGKGNFTHGMQIGLFRGERRDLLTATDELVFALSRNNPNLSRPSSYDRISVDGRQGLRTVLSNGSGERLTVFTVLLDEGNLFYAVGVAPRGDFPDYDVAFRTVVESIEILR